MGRPNVLLVMADQLAPHFTGTYGHPLVRTPALDALAERGTRFDAAYCAAPLCPVAILHARRAPAVGIREAVLASQRARRVLHEAMSIGGRQSWDFGPVRDAANEYVRNHLDWAEAGPRSRFPPLDAPG